jgi:hypothetical protein
MVVKEEVSNVLDILEKAKVAIESNDSIQLKKLSNRTIHTASTAQDTDSILLAVIMYTLSKIIERPEFESKEIKHFCSVCSVNFDKAISSLKKQRMKQFSKSLEGIQRSISKLSPDNKNYVKEVLHKARINKAVKIHEHGISLAKTAELLGVSLWELSSYASSKRRDEREKGISDSVSVKQRVKIAEGIFG